MRDEKEYRVVTARDDGFCVCLAGVPGAGKSTLLEAFVGRPGSMDRHLGGSSIVKAIIAPASVRELDGWPEARRAEVREEAITRLRVLRRATPGRLLIAGHFTLRNRHTGEIEPVFTPGDVAFYDALVLVDPPGSRVIAWRAGDSRDRGSESIARVDEHLAAERLEATRVAAVTKVPFLVVTSTKLADRVESLAAFLDAHAPLGGSR